MTDWSFDMEDGEERADRGAELLVAFVVGPGVETLALCLRKAFPTSDPKVTAWCWCSSFSGHQVPGTWSPYCWADRPTPPDPAEDPALPHFEESE